MKRVLVIFIFLLVFVCSLWAYEENFDTGEAKGWIVITGSWGVEDGEYACVQGTDNDFSFFKESIGNTDWVDYTYEVQVKPVAGPYVGVLFRVQETGIGGPFPDWHTGKFYHWLIGVTPNGAVGYSMVWKALVEEETVLDVAGNTLMLDEWNDVKVEIAGDNIELYLRDKLQKKFTQSDIIGDPYDYGGIGLCGFGSEPHFDNVKVEGPGIPGMAVDPAGKLTTTWGHLRYTRSL